MSAYFYSIDTRLLVKADDNSVITEHNYSMNNLPNQFVSTSVISVPANSEQVVTIPGLSVLNSIMISGDNIFDVSLKEATGIPIFTGIYSLLYYRAFDPTDGASYDGIIIKAFSTDVIAKVSVVGSISP